MRWLTLAVLLASCSDDPEPIAVPCAPDQPAPYPDTSYVGVHAGPSNDDIVACDTGRGFTELWHVLRGQGVIQPNTFSPDGATTYVTATNADREGCHAYALDVEDGRERWCRVLTPAAAAGAIEVDEDGFLYLAHDEFIRSLDPADGSDRWVAELALGSLEGLTSGPLGLHFTPAGRVATVTSTGVVALLDRADGTVLATFDIPAEYGFVPPEPLGDGIDFGALVPEAVLDDIAAVFGDPDSGGDLFGAFLGAGGAFSDNTIGISPRGELYAIGGGEDPDHGALVQVRVEGDTLVAGWAMETVGGSATSPSVSRDGRWVSVGDGASINTILNPDDATAAVKVADIDACDANTDDDPDPARCAPAYTYVLERGSMAGSPALLPDGTTILWETGLRFGTYSGQDDLVAVGPDGVRWSTVLPDEMDVTSVITVANDALVITGTAAERSSERILSINLPRTAETHLLLLDPSDGAVIERHPIPDDAAATVTIGPDGSLYPGMLGLVSILSTEKRPTLGLMRFAPTRLR